MSNSSQLFNQPSAVNNNVANDMRDIVIAVIADEFIRNAAKGEAAGKVRSELPGDGIDQWPFTAHVGSKNYSYEEDKRHAKRIIDIIARNGMNDLLEKMLGVYRKLFDVEITETHQFFRQVWKAGDISAPYWMGDKTTMSEQHILNKILEFVASTFDFTQLLTRIPGDYRQLFINRYLGFAVLDHVICGDTDKFKALMKISRNPDIRVNLIEGVENGHEAATVLHWLVNGLVCRDANLHGVERVRVTSGMIDFMIELGADPDVIMLIDHEPATSKNLSEREREFQISAREAAKSNLGKYQHDDSLNEDIKRSVIEVYNKVINLPRKQNDTDAAHEPVRRSRSFS